MWVVKSGVKVWAGGSFPEPPEPAPQRREYHPYNRMELKPCGTEAGARRHHRRGEEVCEPCKIARSEAESRRYREARGGLRTA